MKLGIATVSISRQFPDERDEIRQYAKIGFEAMDYGGYAHADEDSIYLRDGWEEYAHSLRETADECGMFFSQVHAPMLGAPGTDPGEERKLELTRRYFRLCEILGAPYLVIHPRLFPDGIYGKKREEYIAYNVDFYRGFIPLAQKHGVVIGIENMFGGDPETGALCPITFSTMDDIIECMDRLDSDRFAACLDTGHANIVGIPPHDAVRQLGKRLKLLHVHDNYGTRDDHMACTYGNIDWDAFLDALREVGYSGVFSAETGGMAIYSPAEAGYDAVKLTHSIHSALLREKGML